MNGHPEVSKTKVYIEGHGCSASLADTEILRGLIESGGFELVDNEFSAEVSVLVTCSVKSVTEQRMISRIKDLSKRGTRKVIVAGCLPKAEPDKIASLDSGMSMIGPGNLDKIVPSIHDALKGIRSVTLEPTRLIKTGMPRIRFNRVVGIVEISSGCLSGCTFCQVKLVKGNVFSYPEEQIVEEARILVAQGAKEIWLTSTDNAAYGKDSGTTLPRLLRRVIAIPGDFRVRVGMMNPLFTGRMIDDLISCFQDDKVFKFIHLPVQSGSERLLRSMRRGYKLEDFYKIVDEFRTQVPRITLSTDMIVGFPSETESDFDESQELLREIKPDVVNISRFGPRPGTIAASMDGQVDAAISKDRSTRMTALVKNVQRTINSNWLGWRGTVLLDEVTKDAIIGRNYTYKPCLFALNEVQLREEHLGTEVEATIRDYTSSTLRADPLTESPIVN